MIIRIPIINQRWSDDCHRLIMGMNSFTNETCLLGRFMMTSSNGSIFRVTGHLCGEITGPGEFPAQRPVTRSFDVFFDLCLKNGWVNNCEAGDLRRYRAHYDVIVMSKLVFFVKSTCWAGWGFFWVLWGVCFIRLEIFFMFTDMGVWNLMASSGQPSLI